jgi:hypothetical protein
LTEVGRQCVEVQVQPIAGEDGKTARRQAVTEVMDDRMRRMLRPRPKVQNRDQFRQWVNGHPEPEDVGSTPKAGAQFVELEMRKMEVAEPALV